MTRSSALLFILGFSLILGNQVVDAQNRENLFWPTPSKALWDRAPLESFIQPTVSGRLESGLFGCVRNNGNRFHEGIDIRAERRDRQGESTDPVLSILPGIVRYINRTAGNSSYGRYILIEHPESRPGIYSLYAHLRSIEPGLAPGQQVKAGQQIGILGRSAGGYTIPRERAHLHLEIGLRLSDRFDDWFNRQEFGSPNRHGNFSGLNLVGFDPLEFYQFYRDGRINSVEDYFTQLPTGFQVRYHTTQIPELLLRYPMLLTGQARADRLVAWDIDFTWYGLPLRFHPVEGSPSQVVEGSIEVLGYDTKQFQGNFCRQTIVVQGGGRVLPGRTLLRIMQLMFDD